MLSRMSEILTITDQRELYMQFFNMLQDEAPFLSAELYLFPNDERRIKTFRYIKGRLYEKSFLYHEMEDSLIEEVFIDKTEGSYEVSDLFNKRSLIKNTYYFDEGAKYITYYPLLETSKLHAVLVLLYEDEWKEDLSEYIELLNIRVSMNEMVSKLKSDKLYYQKILHHKKIYPYNIQTLNKDMRKHHDSSEVSKPKTIKSEGKYYELTKVDEENGFLMDVSGEIELKISEQTAYRDFDTKLNTLNKLSKDMSSIEDYSLIQVQFESVYLLDVTKQLLEVFKRNQLFRSENSIYILVNHTDKRVLNKHIRETKDQLSNIMTFEYKLGVLRVPIDVKRDILDMLQIVTDSEHEFYDKKTHKAVVNTLVTKKQIISKIQNDSYELKFHPIVNTRNQLEGYLVTHGIDSETIKDKRIELLITQYTLESIRRVEKRAKFFINVSDELVKTNEFLDVLKQFRHFQDYYKDITFIFDTAHSEAEQYLLSKESKIARKSVEMIYQDEKDVDYLFQNIVYDNYSKEYIHFLGSLEDKGIIPIFEVAEKSDLQYVVDNGIGFVYTKMAQDVLIVKG